MKPLQIIISGGGTGGHIYPAVSIANSLKARYPDTEILFVGAEGRMEMEKVPAAGYKIIGLPVAGLQRKSILKNILLPFKIWKSIRKASKIICDFNPDAVIGVGGYASGPVLWAAQRKKTPTLLQEQNSYAGITNKILAKRATKICVAYDNMERFFPKEKIHLTGNPVRQDLHRESKALRADAAAYFGMNPDKKTVFIFGGSLGARALNLCMAQALPELTKGDVQFIWQSGKNYAEIAKTSIQQYESLSHIKVFDFIYRMDYAYAMADVVISRAGASSISELCVVAKPCIFVPSPNVSEDHQTKNAQSLVDKKAALLVSDDDASRDLIPTALQLIGDEEMQQTLANNIAKLAKPNAANEIVDEIMKLVSQK